MKAKRSLRGGRVREERIGERIEKRGYEKRSEERRRKSAE